jgi:hypothetical protein
MPRRWDGYKSSPSLDLNGIAWMLKEHGEAWPTRMCGRPVIKKLQPCTYCFAELKKGQMYYSPPSKAGRPRCCASCMAKDGDARYVPDLAKDAAFVAKLVARRKECVDDFDCFDFDIAEEPAGLAEREATHTKAQVIKQEQLTAVASALRKARSQQTTGAELLAAAKQAASRFPRPSGLPPKAAVPAGGAYREFDHCGRECMNISGACERWLFSAPRHASDLSIAWQADTINFACGQGAEDCAEALARVGQEERELSAAMAASTAASARPSAKKLEKERQALGNAAFSAKYAPTAEEKQRRKARDEVGFIAHVLEQRILDVQCNAVWAEGGDAAAGESEARPTKAARVA